MTAQLGLWDSRVQTPDFYSKLPQLISKEKGEDRKKEKERAREKKEEGKKRKRKKLNSGKAMKNVYTIFSFSIKIIVLHLWKMCSITI